MKRVAMTERSDWQIGAEACGFSVHTMDGRRYWDERHAYVFGLDEIETMIEDPTADLLSLCYRAVDEISKSPALMRRMAIPDDFHQAVARSWRNGDRDLYGRFDLAYDGTGPAKLFEFNADTPTSLFEAAVFQWYWLEDMKARGYLSGEADQFNSLHERLIKAFELLGGKETTFHFAGLLENAEDRMTLEYLADCATQAGCRAKLIEISDIGIDAADWMTDADDTRISTLFKLYPLEDMVREEFGTYLSTTPTRMIEPLWKLTLSNKGLMPVLWDLFPDHPNLLPSFFEDDPRVAELAGRQVVKPLLSREGANITLVDPATMTDPLQVEGPYGEEGKIVQALNLLPRFGDSWTLIGSWVVAGQPAGMGIREDDTPITGITARFVPHYIDGA